jgi:hypothetical protein
MMNVNQANATRERPGPRQAQPVPAVSGMGCGLCGPSRSRMAFSAWVWGDSDRGSKSTSRRSAVIRTARSLSERSSRCITSNMARKPSDGKAGPPAHARRGDAGGDRGLPSKASIAHLPRYADQWGPGGYVVEPARMVRGQSGRMPIGSIRIDGGSALAPKPPFWLLGEQPRGSPRFILCWRPNRRRHPAV